MLLPLLLLLLIILVFIEYEMFDKNILSPAFLFTAGFCVCSFGACLYQSVWEYDISPELFILLITLISCFGVTCYITRYCYFRQNPIHKKIVSPQPIRKQLILFIIIIQALVLIWSLLYIRSAFPSGSLFDAIGAYNNSAKFNSTQYGSAETIDVSWPFPLGPLRTICESSSYFVFYLLAQELVMKRKDALHLLAISSLASFCITLETGSRGVAVGYALFLIACYAIMYFKIHYKMIQFTVQRLGVAIVVATVFLASFRVLAIGREGDFGSIEYLSIYMGAQIPNLDAFISNTNLPTSDFFGQQTFRTSLEYLGGYFNIPSWLSIPYTWTFQEMGGSMLGNVYTTFYPFLQDGGVFGAFFFTILMAAISQAAYNVAIYGKDEGKGVSIIVYSYMVPPILLSFFAYRFYSDVLSIPFLRTLTIILIVRWIYLRVGGKRKGEDRFHSSVIAAKRSG